MVERYTDSKSDKIAAGMKPIGLYMEERASAFRGSGLDAKLFKAIVTGNYTPSPLQPERLAAVLSLSTDEISWGHSDSGGRAPLAVQYSIITGRSPAAIAASRAFARYAWRSSLVEEMNTRGVEEEDDPGRASLIPDLLSQPPGIPCAQRAIRARTRGVTSSILSSAAFTFVMACWQQLVFFEYAASTGFAPVNGKEKRVKGQNAFRATRNPK